MNPTVQKLQNRLQLLHPIKATDKGLWGVMTGQNMIEHLGMVFYVNATGKNMPVVMPPERVAKLKARFFSAYYPFPKNTKMPGTQNQPPVAPPLRYDSMETAQKKLHSAVAKFLTVYQTNPTQTVTHGYFGDLTMEEWLHFHIKHVEHHLRQFGQLPPADEKITQLEKLLYKVNTKITADTSARWGQMNAHQMVEHLGLVFVLSTGRFKLQYQGTPEEAQRYWQGFQKADMPWKTVFPQVQFGKPRPTRHATIAESKVALGKTFQKYLAYCEKHPDAIHAHFFLGNLTVAQWRYVHVKHLIHHLRQFGIDI